MERLYYFNAESTGILTQTQIIELSRQISLNVTKNIDKEVDRTFNSAQQRKSDKPVVIDSKQ